MQYDQRLVLPLASPPDDNSVNGKRRSIYRRRYFLVPTGFLLQLGAEFKRSHF
jgi:hypothetical protein